MRDSIVQASLLAVVLLAGLSAGSVALLLLGRLLGRDWLAPVDNELRPTGLTLPLVALFAVPLAFSGIGNFEPVWPTGLIAIAFAVSQLAPALALALLVNIVRGHDVERAEERSLASALLTLALAGLGLWFMQFLAAWMGNLPDAVNWYQSRLVGGRWLAIAAAAVALFAAILLLLIRRTSRRLILIASALLVGQHLLHMAWLLRPYPLPPIGPVDLAVVALLGGLWAAVWFWLMRRSDRARDHSGGTTGGQRGASSA